MFIYNLAPYYYGENKMNTYMLKNRKTQVVELNIDNEEHAKMHINNVPHAHVNTKENEIRVAVSIEFDEELAKKLMLPLDANHNYIFTETVRIPKTNDKGEFVFENDPRGKEIPPSYSVRADYETTSPRYEIKKYVLTLNSPQVPINVDSVLENLLEKILAMNKAREIATKLEEERRKAYEEYLMIEKQKEEEARKAEERRKEFLRQIWWVKKLNESLEIERKREQEINRFINKFGITRDMISVSETSDAPYVDLCAEVPIFVDDRRVKVYNYKLKDESENYENVRYEFSDLSKKIAEALATIFGGVVVTKIQNAEALLLVETEEDTIKVAETDVEDDC